MRTACRSCSCTAVPAAAACRTIAATSTPAFWRIALFDQRGAGRSHARGGARRQHDAAPRRRHRGAAPASRHRPLAAVRRLVGIDPGARLRARRIRSAASGWCCAASSSRARPRSTGSCTGCATCSPRPGARSPNSCRPPSAPTSSATTIVASSTRIPRCTCPRRRRGTATKARARRCCRRPDPVPKFDSDAHGARDRAHRGALLRPPRVSRARTSCSRISAGSATCPARSSRGATTSCVRS